MSLNQDIERLKMILNSSYITYGAAKLFSVKETIEILRLVKRYQVDLRGIIGMRRMGDADLYCTELKMEYSFIHESLEQAIIEIADLGEDYFFELLDIDGVLEYIKRTYGM